MAPQLPFRRRKAFRTVCGDRPLHHSGRFDARKFDGAQVVVEVSGSSTECKVSIRSEKVGRVVACGRLVEYFGDQLHLRPGTKYYFVDSGNSHRGEINALVSAMKASGYPPVGVMAVFISEPAPINER
jgi:hypothetical protein